MKKITILLILIFSCLPEASYTQDSPLVAVAANFTEPFKEIAVLFESKTHIHFEPTFSSTGKLYAQIIEGAPYDLFLAADETRPGELFQKGLSVKPFVYAKGEVVLWTAQKDLCSLRNWKSAVTNNNVKRISIANTESAPYGTSSMVALKSSGMWESLQNKFVFSQDIAQSFQYAFTGSVDVAFCAKSSALTDKGKSGCYLEVKEAPVVVQSGCVLNRTRQRQVAEEFAVFLFSPEANSVKQKYGYH